MIEDNSPMPSKFSRRAKGLPHKVRDLIEGNYYLIQNPYDTEWDVYRYLGQLSNDHMFNPNCYMFSNIGFSALCWEKHRLEAMFARRLIKPVMPLPDDATNASIQFNRSQEKMD